MLKKILTAVVFALLIIQLNICAAMIQPDKIYLGGLTFGSKISEMKNIHGEPDTIFFGTEGYSSCNYGDGVSVTFNKISGLINGIFVTEKIKAWEGHNGLSVGMKINDWLITVPEPDEVKVGTDKTVYLYFHYKSDPVIHETFRDYGLFIAVNNQSGKITEIRIEGDTDLAKFEEFFESTMYEMTLGSR